METTKATAGGFPVTYMVNRLGEAQKNPALENVI